MSWLSISAYARKYNVDRKTVYKWKDAGLLETFRVGMVTRIQDQPPRFTKSVSSAISPPNPQ